MSIKLPDTENLLVKIEDTATAISAAMMTDAGDRQTFSSSGTRFSLCENDSNGADRRPVVRPDGLRNGCLVVPSLSGANDSIDIYPGTAWKGNSQITVSQVTDLSITRPSATKNRIASVVINSSGAVAVIDGTDGTGFSEMRGLAGGPPYIPAGEVELATVKMNSDTPASLKEEEVIFAPEICHAPGFTLLPYTAEIKFNGPLPAIHTGGTAKNVWITMHEPVLAQLDVLSFTPPLETIDTDPLNNRYKKGETLAGSMVVTLSGDQADMPRRIDGSIRLIEFMPDSTGNRKEVFYAALLVSADYSPASLMAGKISILPIYSPEIETV